MVMAASGSSRWYFREEKIKDSASRRHGITPDKEESYRQQAANFIQDMGQRLQVTQLCINTAIVYMQRFYMFHSFTRFHRNSIAAAALFLAAKVEEQPRKLEHVIKVSYICLHRDQPQLDAKSEQYLEQAQELVCNENILLQTLGFDVAIDHPHTHVVKCCQLVKASKELAQTSYFMATNSLHLTTMCLRYTPTIVACVCIHLACKWSNYAIPQSAQGKGWFWYVDPTATQEMLEKLTQEFLEIFDKCPSRLKKKIMQSHDATKEEEERRARDNTQGSQYKIDFGVLPGKQPSQQPPSARPSVQPGQQRPPVKQEPGSRPQPHPQKTGQPPRSHPQYPPGHPSQPQQPPVKQEPGGQQPLPGGRKPGSTQQNQYRPDRATGKPPPKVPEQRPRSHPPSHPGQPPEAKPRAPPDLVARPPGHREHSASRDSNSASRDSSNPRDQREHSASRDQKPRAPPPSYPGVKQPSSSSRPQHPAKQPPPYPGHKQPPVKPQPQVKPDHRKPTSKPRDSATMRSLFDINESPEKLKPNPPHLDMNPPPAMAHFNQSIMSPISDKDLSRASSLEPGELLDTPTPSFHTQQPPYFPNNATHTQRPPSPRTLLSPIKPSNTSSLGTMSIMSPMPSLDSLLGFPEKMDSLDAKPEPPSRLQQTLFDPEYSDLDVKPKLETLDVKPKLETVDYKQYNDVKPKLEQKYVKPEPISPSKHSKHRSRNDPAKTDTLASLLANPVSDLSPFPSHLQQKLGSTTNMLNPMAYGQPGPPQGLSHSQQGLQQQSHQYTPQIKTTPKQASRSDRSREKESSSKKRKSSERSGSGSEEKKTKSSLFSPSPEKLKSPGFGLLSPMKDEEGRTRTVSTSSSNAEPFVNIQKLESIAPECQTFKNSIGPASILLPDGQEELQQVAHEEQFPPQDLQQTQTSRQEHHQKISSHHQDKSRKSGSGSEKASHHRSTSSSHRSSSEQKRSSGQHHPPNIQNINHIQNDQPQQPLVPPPVITTEPLPPISAPSLPEKTISPEKAPHPSPVKQKEGGAIVSAPGSEEAKRHKEKDRHKDKEHKKHKKEKKSKSHKDDKERKDKKDKHHDHSKEGKDEHRSSKHKKSKSKHKEKDKERGEKNHMSSSVVNDTGGSDTPQLKIKLKTTPSVSPRVEPAQTTSNTPSQPNPSIPKIKIKFGGSEIGQVVSGSESKADRHSKSSTGSSHKKRERSQSSTKLDGPAAKMARAMGTRTEPEAKFLEEHFSTEKRKSSKDKSSKPKL